MKYSKYPSYKDSGVEWLGDVPEHWLSASLKWISKIYSGGTPDKTNLSYWTEGAVPWISSGEVNQFYITTPTTYITEEAYSKSSAKWIPKDALVMALAGQGKTKGMVAQLGIKTTCNQSMAAIILSCKIHPRFILWWLSGNYENIRNLAGGDLRDGLNLELLGGIFCPFIELKEQQAIANYLDKATDKIDTLISKQTKLIELLKEKRQALISHAVTKGLNPHAKMKQSGVEWLGEIPEDWEALKLKRISSIKGGYAFSTTDFIEDGVQIIKIGNVYQSKFHIDRQPTFVSEELAKKVNEFLIVKSDLIISLTGTLGKKDYGYAVTVDQEGKYLLNQRVAKMIPNNKLVSTEYLSYVMKSEQYLTQIYALPSGTKQANLSNDDVLSAVCALPSLSEQEHIVNYINDKTQKIDNLIEKAIKAIELLKERRTALISSAVTGKIDVREMA